MEEKETGEKAKAKLASINPATMKETVETLVTKENQVKRR